MKVLDFLQQYSGAFTFLATFILVAVTIIYVRLTKRLISASEKQAKLSFNPVIGIEIDSIKIGKVFSEKRRNMGVNLALTNVGNAPAIELFVDAEIELTYSPIKGNRLIPARFIPDMVAFVKPGQKVERIRPNFGNTLITHFFADVKESRRLNLHRIETAAKQKAFKTSRIIIYAYYKNSLGQYFQSQLEYEIGLLKDISKDPIPNDDEVAEVTLIYIPRPIFHSDAIDEDQMHREISDRKDIRKLCGW